MFELDEFLEDVILEMARQRATQSSVCEVTGIGESTLSMVLTGGIQNPSIWTISDLAAWAGLSIDDYVYEGR